jgi:hypothetical protein
LETHVQHNMQSPCIMQYIVGNACGAQYGNILAMWIVIVTSSLAHHGPGYEKSVLLFNVISANYPEIRISPSNFSGDLSKNARITMR